MCINYYDIIKVIIMDIEFTKPTLVEPGTKYFLNETLVRCAKFKKEYYNNMLNIIVIIFIIISVGGIWETAFENQPSIKLLKLFKIYDFFGEHQYLSYKTSSKNPTLEKLSPCLFFDDDPKHLVNAAKIRGIEVIDSTKINDWKKYKY